MPSIPPPQVLDKALETEKIIERYEVLASDLLEWIEKTIGIISNQKFANSLVGVQQQLQAFTTYCTIEKPIKFQEKGNLEVLLFTIQSKLRANNQKLYVPHEGKLISEINKAWERLEKAEHERGVALRTELIRQEKLELLAQRFDHKATMREAWLNENQRLVSQDNFGYDLPAVEAAMKKHEAIEADISSYEERIAVVVELSGEMESESYYDVRRIAAQKDNILRQWNLLKELVTGRRARLERNLTLQNTFQEMVYMIDWMEEIQDNFGYDLPAVEAAMKKHEAIEADISSYEERIAVVVELSGEMESESYYDVRRIAAQKDNILRQWNLLKELVTGRRARLERNLTLQNTFQEMVYMIDWMEEIQVLLLSKDFGKHLLEVDDLLQKHGLLEADISVQAERVKTLNTAALKFTSMEALGNELGDSSSDLKNPKNMASLLQPTYRFGGLTINFLRHVTADISVQAERVKTLNTAALKFTSMEGYQPCDPQVICNRVNHVSTCLEELKQLASKRRSELEESRQLWTFFQEMEEFEAWIWEKTSILATQTFGKDLSSVLKLLNKHKILAGELLGRRSLLQQTMKKGKQILTQKCFGTGHIQEKIMEVKAQWKKLEDHAGLRLHKLQEALSFFQFNAEMDDLLAWLQDTYRLVSSEDFGHDEYSTQSLMKKHKGVAEEIEKHRIYVVALRKHKVSLSAQYRDLDEVQNRMAEVEQLYTEVAEVTVLRQQWLHDALAVYRMFSEVNACEVWIDEKEQWLNKMEIPEKLEDVEVVAHRKVKFESLDQEMNSLMERILDVNQIVQQLLDGGHPSSAEVRGCQDHLNGRFESLDQEMNSLMERILDVNQIVQQLLDGGHPSSAEVRGCQDHLNGRWNRIVELVEQKKDHLNSVVHIQNYLLECTEMQSQISEKRKAIETTQYTGTDLGGVLALQRKLSTMEGALAILEPKLISLQQEAEELAATHPSQAMEILVQFEQISVEWDELKRTLQGCEDSLTVASRLQQFIQDLDNFLTWLVRTQTAVASEELPNNLEEAERLINQHATLKEEIGRYEEDYNQIQAVNKLLAVEEAELPYISLQQWLQKLDVGWNKLLEMWESRREVLVQSHIFHLFLRDVKQAESFLNNQESALAHVELPTTVETVEATIKKHRNFSTTMDLNLQKIKAVIEAGESLMGQGNIYSERIKERIEIIHTRYNHPPGQPAIYTLESALAHVELPTTVETVEATIKKHRNFSTTMDLNLQKIKAVIEAGESLMGQGNIYSERIKERIEIIHTRSKKNRGLAEEWLHKLLDQWELQRFLQDCHELLQEKFTEFASETGSLGQERVSAVNQMADELIDYGHADAATIAEWKDGVNEAWADLLELMETRAQMLAASHQLHKFFDDCREVLSQIEDKQKRLPEVRARQGGCANTNTMQRLMQSFERDIQQLVTQVRQLQESAAQLRTVYAGEKAEAIAGREQEVMQAWKELLTSCEECRVQITTATDKLRFFGIVRDLISWMDSIICQIGTGEKPSRDLSAFQLLQEKFTEFASETGSLGQERVSAVNQMADELIDYGHADAATIAEWKDGVNEAWADLLELMETRAQMLAASHQLHKFFDDCREVLSQIEDKQKRLPEVRARQGGSANTSSLQRLMHSFERDIQQLVTQVRQLQESAAQLRTVYAGEKAEAIAGREQEVMQAWKELLTSCEECRVQITTATDKLRFFGIARDLISWMDSIICQIGTGEKPRDVSSVEVLMNYHQGLKNEIEARNKNMAQCVEMGKMLLAARNPATEEIKEKLEKVIAKQKELSEKWDKHWEWLQHMLEVHQFAQEAVVADAWLTAQEPFIKSQELGSSVDEVEQLIRRHEAFRKAAATWEERFSSLRRLTSIKEKLEKVIAKQKELSEKWDKHWEWLQHMLEVHQFAQEAVVADAWLTAQEPFIKSQELGSSVDEVEQLIRRHEAFRKAAATWEERFSSLRRLTSLEKLKAEQSKLPPTPMLGRKVFVDPQEAGLAWTPSSVMRQTIYEQVEPKTKRHPEIASSSGKKLGSTTASSYTPVMNGTKYGSLNPRNEPKIVYVHQELKPERLQPKIDHLADCVQPALEAQRLERERQEQRLTNPHREGAQELVNGTQEHAGVRASRSDLQTEKKRPERQTSSDQEIRARRDELPQERRRHNRRLERQSSSEEDAPPRKEELRRERHERKQLERQESSEQDRSEKRTGGEKRSTLADIVEQLQEREQSHAAAQVRERDPGPRLHNGLPERTPRPDRPRARDRPKPRRRPRPKDPNAPAGETRRSRSAPAQSTCSAPPAPPSHTAKQEGCMFRKHEVEIEKKASNRSWVNLYCIVTNGEMGFYKDAKNTTTTFNGEPIISLNNCICDVANGYKKKKNVFKLKTVEGSEFLFHTRDEMDLKNWVKTITTAISEHEEIAKWAQTQPTTSSTDESRKTAEERRLSVSSKKK
ncbi:UNVERIFIED_CONTAM: hypothetical protein FKN15_020718 [Acipenser sinensis]